ncbi:SpoIVB peptidase [Oscillospiraceae bacterium CM]|nr:SpoIVB peptidase [Oscillospiraceae bacterium CM]
MGITKLYKKLFSGFLLLTVLAFSCPGTLAAGKALIPMGNAVGISLSSDGVMVVGVPETMPDGVTASPARDAGVAVGDIITQIGSQHVSSNDDLKAAIKMLDGSPVAMTVLRGGKTMSLKMTPHKSNDGACELGLWLRDGIAGIGTLTFYDPETHLFGALGHAVNDAETGVLIPLRTGQIMRSSVTDVILGKAGMPGQLHGTFNTESVLGTLMKNSTSGIFGTLDNEDLIAGKTAVPIAKTSEIKTGPAKILSNVSGTDVVSYDVEITRVYTGTEAVGRTMMITVTDKRLIEKTGGIVQGMSGSPILQDGKLIGAVTHVLVNDPTKGYGIDIENMLSTAKSAAPSKAA